MRLPRAIDRPFGVARDSWARPAIFFVAIAGGLFVVDRVFGVSPFAAALAARARGDIGQATTGARVRALIAPYDPSAINWCALAVTGWMKETAKALGVAPPIAGSGLAKDLMRQAIAAGRWVTAAELRASPSRIREGMIPVYTRGDPSGPWGHTDVVVAGGAAYHTVDGNACAAGVCERTHDITSDPNLLGMVQT